MARTDQAFVDLLRGELKVGTQTSGNVVFDVITGFCKTTKKYLTTPITGLYAIVDGGYNTHRCLQCPFDSFKPDDGRWSENLESVRKNIECVFGRLKRRFQFWKRPIEIRRLPS